MKKQDLELQVREIIADKFCLDLEKVTIDSLLKNELGADSLDEIELVIDLEIAFDIEISDDDVDDENCAFKEYQEAKNRVLFEGFEFSKMHDNKLNNTIHYQFILHVFWRCSVTNTWNLSKGLSIIEDLVKYNLELTPTALKQIGYE